MTAEARVSTVPNDENAIDIFKGEWSTPLAENITAFRSGDLTGFQDPRILWACEQFGDLGDQRVLELGPFEAADTCVLEQSGTAAIVAVEPNTKSYLKCLIVKELAPLRRTQFLCGDYLEFLRHNAEHFDLCVASGVLYRVINPVELIARCARTSDRIYMWTHYYDAEILSTSDGLFGQFSAGTPAEFEGFQCDVYAQRAETAGWHGFHHSTSHHSFWMTRADILACLKYFGFVNIITSFEQPDHPHGPSFALMAARTSVSRNKGIHGRSVNAPELTYRERWYPADEPIVSQTEVFNARLTALRSRLDALESRMNRYTNVPPLRWLRRLRTNVLGLPPRN